MKKIFSVTALIFLCFNVNVHAMMSVEMMNVELEKSKNQDQNYGFAEIGKALEFLGLDEDNAGVTLEEIVKACYAHPLLAKDGKKRNKILKFLLKALRDFDH